MSEEDYFTLFELPPRFKQDQEAIKSKYYLLQKKMHPDHFLQTSEQEQRLALQRVAMLNDAYVTLRIPLKRATYLLNKKGITLDPETDTHMPTEFLMAQMELRERILSGEQEAVRQEIQAYLQEGEIILEGLIDQEPSDLLQAREWVRKMQFYDHLEVELRAVSTI